MIIRGAKNAIDHLIAIAEALYRVDPKGYKSHNKTWQPTDLTQDQQKVLDCPLAYIHIDIDCQCDWVVIHGILIVKSDVFNGLCW